MNSFTHSFNTHLFSRRLPWGWQGFTHWKTVVSEAGRDTKWICKPGNKQATVRWGSVLRRKQNRVFNSAFPRRLRMVLPFCPGCLGRAPLRRKDGSWDLSHSRKLCQVKLWTSTISHCLQGAHPSMHTSASCVFESDCPGFIHSPPSSFSTTSLSLLHAASSLRRQGLVHMRPKEEKRVGPTTWILESDLVKILALPLYNSVSLYIHVIVHDYIGQFHKF